MLGDAYRFGTRYGWIFALAAGLGAGDVIAAVGAALFRGKRSWRELFLGALGAAALALIWLAYAAFGRPGLVNPTMDGMALAAGATLLASLPLVRSVFAEDPDEPGGAPDMSGAKRVLLREGLLPALIVFVLGAALIGLLWYYCGVAAPDPY